MHFLSSFRFSSLKSGRIEINYISFGSEMDLTWIDSLSKQASPHQGYIYLKQLKTFQTHKWVWIETAAARPGATGRNKENFFLLCTFSLKKKTEDSYID